MPKTKVSRMMSAIAITCRFIAGSIPLHAQAQIVADGAGVTVNLNGSQLMHRTPVAYPAEALAKGVEGTVVVQARLDPNGEVIDDAVLSGPDELRKNVQQSVLSWHFDKSAGPSTRVVNIDFVKLANAPVVRVDVTDLSDTSTAGLLPPPNLAVPPGAALVGGNVEASNLINSVTPVYPPLAKMARQQGTVKFQATIGKDGTVDNLLLISGPPLLVRAALDAVKQWTYKPMVLNGAPVEVVTTIDVNFSLSE